MKKKKTQHFKPKKEKKVSNKIVLNHFIQNPTQPFNYKQIASALKANSTQEKHQLLNTLAQLAAKEDIIEVDKGKFKLNTTVEVATGKIDITQSGSAYLISETKEKDVYISKKNTLNALNGDLVKVQIVHSKNKAEGKVLEVLERKNTEFVGTFQLAANKNFGFVVGNKRQMHVDMYISKDKFNNAQDNEKVIVKLTGWPTDTDSPFGEVIEVLGMAGEHETEIHSILADYGLPYKFPEEVEQEAQNIDTTISEEEVSKRKDLRKVTTITIDPKDAKDFDDAISFEKLENGNYEIGIHIADVSHYVQPDTLLDEEAFKRATSVYLVDRVVPMLPEVLSNKVCSLRPNEEKYTFSAMFEMNDQAEIKNQWFGRTVINSDRRFTYEEAQEIIEGKPGDFQEEILKLDKIAKVMRTARLKNGAIAFDKLEVKFALDDKGNPIEVYFKESKDANHLVEEFMLLANKKVSEFVSTKKNGMPNQNTFVYRIHDDPDPAKLASLKDFVRTFGYNMNIDSKRQISTSLNNLLKEVKGKGEENMIETLAMRSMSKAVYSTENIGHYGLAFDYYSHFTSPIRRYPDVIAHRLLQHYLDGGKSPARDGFEEECVHCSEREKLASDAERSSTKYMQVKFMENHIGEVFDGVISGVTEWGIYVETVLSKAEGLIRLKDITDDHYIFNEKTHSIVGQRTKSEYQLGDTVKIKVLKCDLEKKQIDFSLVS